MILPDFSVIIPVFHEASIIDDTIAHILDVAAGTSVEILVVDGAPSGDTIQTVGNDTIGTAIAEKGRGSQLNRGAALAKGEFLLFLHADTRLVAGSFRRIATAMSSRKIMAGAFRLAIDSPGFPYRIIEKAVWCRSRFLGLPYGDQGIFIRREDFLALGGFRNVPIMEDVDLMRRIQKKKGRIFILDEPILTSARRWEREGILYCTLRNWFLLLLFFLGASPEKLIKFYPSPVRPRLFHPDREDRIQPIPYSSLELSLPVHFLQNKHDQIRKERSSIDPL